MLVPFTEAWPGLAGVQKNYSVITQLYKIKTNWVIIQMYMYINYSLQLTLNALGVPREVFS